VQRLPLQALDGRAAIPVVIVRPGGCALASFPRPFPVARLRHHLFRFILDNSLLLLAGSVGAVVWANVDSRSYDAVAHPLHFWVNDVGMVFFFALAAKVNEPSSRFERL
jgi:hypothetical protein